MGKDGEDSSRSLMVEIPFLDEMVKVADSRKLIRAGAFDDFGHF